MGDHYSDLGTNALRIIRARQVIIANPTNYKWNQGDCASGDAGNAVAGLSFGMVTIKRALEQSNYNQKVVNRMIEALPVLLKHWSTFNAPRHIIINWTLMGLLCFMEQGRRVYVEKYGNSRIHKTIMQISQILNIPDPIIIDLQQRIDDEVATTIIKTFEDFNNEITSRNSRIANAQVITLLSKKLKNIDTNSPNCNTAVIRIREAITTNQTCLPYNLYLMNGGGDNQPTTSKIKAQIDDVIRSSPDFARRFDSHVNNIRKVALRDPFKFEQLDKAYRDFYTFFEQSLKNDFPYHAGNQWKSKVPPERG